MGKNFDEEDAIDAYSNRSIEYVLETVAARFMGANPRCEYVARPFFAGKAIIRNKNYRYEADFDKIFPQAALGSYVFARGKYRAEEEGELKFVASWCKVDSRK